VQRRGPPKFVPVSELSQYVGFRSVYEFDASTVEKLKAVGNTRELRHLPVYSETLFADFDNNPEAARKFADLLRSRGVAFEVWHSGGRSVHFHMPLEPQQGFAVPNSQRAWMRVNAPGADLSFYHAGGIYRLPNTFHAKYPGHCKQLLASVPGELLRIETVQTPLPTTTTETDDENAARVYLALLNQPASEGNRTPHCFKLLRAAKRAGQTYEEFLLDLNTWNSDFADPPHTQQTLQQWAERTWKQN
jgi:hypothetical protein